MATLARSARVLFWACVFLVVVVSCGHRRERIVAEEAVLRGIASLPSPGDARVSVRAIERDGGRGPVLATARTDAHGRFEVVVPGTAGPVHVHVTEADGPGGDAQHVAVTLGAIPRRPVAVTALTDVAASLVRWLHADGAEIADAINTASSVTARAAGLATIHEPPAVAGEPIAGADVEAAKYALLLGGIAQCAAEKGARESDLRQGLIADLKATPARSTTWRELDGCMRRFQQGRGAAYGFGGVEVPLVAGDRVLANVVGTVGGGTGSGSGAELLDCFITSDKGFTLPPGGSANFCRVNQDLVPIGGFPDLVWSFVTPPPSGGSLSRTPGLDCNAVYTAGRTGGVTDRVRAQNANAEESLCKPAEVDVIVTPGISITSMPATLTVAPLGTIDFDATGGSNSGFSWTIVKRSGGDALIDPATGLYRAGGAGSATDTVIVTDDLGNTASADVVVTAPLALAVDAASVPPRGTATFTASAGQPPYTYAVRTGASGAPTLGATGAYKAGGTPDVIDVVQVIDANGAVATRSLPIGPGIRIAPPTPVASLGGTITFSATGGSGAGFAWSMTGGSGGSIDPLTGAYVAGTTPAVDEVRVVDPLGNVALARVAVGGGGVAINPAGASVPPRGAITFTASGGSGAGFVWSMESAPSGGSVTPGGAYVAGKSANTLDRITVTDALGNRASVTVVVGPGLSINPPSAEVPPGGEVFFGSSGGSGAGLVFRISEGGSGGTITTDGRYRAGANGGVVDTVIITDSVGNTATATITVGPTLVATTSAIALPPGAARRLLASGGAGVYVFSFQTNASGGTLSPAGGYVAGRKPNVTDVLRVVDQTGAVATIRATVGDGVTLTPPSASVAPGGGVIFSASGGSGEGFVFHLPRRSSGGTIGIGGAYRAGSIDQTFDVVEVVDSLGNKATATVSVGAGLAITPTNASPPPRGVVAFGALGGAGGYRWALAKNASGGAIDAGSGRYTAGPTGGAIDIVELTDAVERVVTLAITVGASLRVTPEVTSVKSGASVVFSASGGSGDGLSWAVTNNPSGGSIDAQGTYRAGANAAVTDTITLTDSLGNVATALVAVTRDGNAPPAPPAPPARGPEAGPPTESNASTSATGDAANAGCARCSASRGSTGAPEGVAWVLATSLVLRRFTRRRRR